MDKNILIIGRRLKLLRMEKSLSQLELAQKIGVTQTSFSNMENGRVAITLQNFLKIKEVLGCKMRDFFVDIDGADDEISSADLQEMIKLWQMVKGQK